MRRIKERPGIAAKLGVSTTALTKSGEFKFVWNYGDEESAKDSETRHKFALIDHNGEKFIDLRKLRAYFGAREFGDGWIPWAIRIEITLAIVKGMQCLSYHGIVHGRLRSVNVAVGTSFSGKPGHCEAGGTWSLGRVSIMDYGECYVGEAFGGLSFGPTDDGPEVECVWRAPELNAAVRTRQRVSSEGDVWSLGVIMWEIWTGRKPRFSRIQMDAAKIISSKSSDVFNSAALDSSSQQPPPGSYLQAMAQCLSPSPALRPSFAQVESLILSTRATWPPEYLPG